MFVFGSIDELFGIRAKSCRVLTIKLNGIPPSIPVLPSNNFPCIADETVSPIEEYGKTCKPVPPALIYKVRVDKSYLDFHLPITTGVYLLTKANKLPVEKYDLFKVVSTNPQPQKIHDLHEPINLREKCLVRFVTLPKEQKDGE